MDVALNHRSRLFAAMPGSAIRRILSLTDRPDVLSLAGGLPNPATFPTDEIAAATERVLRTNAAAALQYARTEGVGELRALLADDATTATGRPHGVDNVLVTTGSQQALDLIARTYVDAGDVVAIEQPGYLGAIGAFACSAPRWLPLPVDRDGIVVDALEDHLAAGVDIRLLYTATDFQNPTGAVLAPDRRLRLARLADQFDFLIVEDDPYGAIRFGEPVHPPIAATTERTVRLGSTSKSIAPGLRVGWAVGPASLIADLARAKQTTDLNTSALNQFVVADLFGDVDWMPRRSAALSAFYEHRARTLCSALAADPVLASAAAEPRGGLFAHLDLTHVLPVGGSSTQLLDTAIELGVAFVPAAAFRTDGCPDDSARVSFATLDDDALGHAVGRLSAAIDACHRQALDCS